MVHLQGVSGAEKKREGLQFDLLGSATVPELHILSSPLMKPTPVAAPRKYLIFFFFNQLCSLYILETVQPQDTTKQTLFTIFFFLILLHAVHKQIL